MCSPSLLITAPYQQSWFHFTGFFHLVATKNYEILGGTQRQRYCGSSCLAFLTQYLISVAGTLTSTDMHMLLTTCSWLCDINKILNIKGFSTLLLSIWEYISFCPRYLRPHLVGLGYMTLCKANVKRNIFVKHQRLCHSVHTTGAIPLISLVE